MDAVEYLKTKNRMTEACTISCDNCPLCSFNNKVGISCNLLERNKSEKAIKIVENWGKEYPVKTFLTDFLEKYPKVLMASNNTPRGICPYFLGYIEFNDCINDCIKCWNTELITKERE